MKTAGRYFARDEKCYLLYNGDTTNCTLDLTGFPGLFGVRNFDINTGAVTLGRIEGGTKVTMFNCTGGAVLVRKIAG